MVLVTSSTFASAAASGTDWRDTSRKVLEELESIKTREDQFTLGFLYITDSLAGDASSILNLFRSVTGIKDWIGCCGLGVCGAGQEFIDQPAISAMVAQVNPEEYRIFQSTGFDPLSIEDVLQSWSQRKDAYFVFTHGDPMAEMDPARGLQMVQETTGAFVVGGLSSSRKEHIQIAGELWDGGFSGVVFSSALSLSTSLSQGCQPIGKLHTVTQGEDNVIYALDNRKPFDVFREDLKEMVARKSGQNPDDVILDDGFSGSLMDIPHEFREFFKGDMHVAFAVSGSDTQDYLVRNIIGIDPDDGMIAVAHPVHTGDHILFAHRDDKTILSELSSMLLSFRERIKKERGGDCVPKAGIFVSCAGRAYTRLEKGSPGEGSGEMQLIRDILGDFPITGFYASGEISNTRLYGYTGILTLFF